MQSLCDIDTVKITSKIYFISEVAMYLRSLFKYLHVAKYARVE